MGMTAAVRRAMWEQVATCGHSGAAVAPFGVDGARPDSHATVYQDRESLGRSKGDQVAFADLPYEIRRDVGEM